MVSSRTLIIGLVAGVFAAGLGLVLYNNIQHRPTPFEILNSTEQGRKLLRQEYDKLIDQDVERMKNWKNNWPKLHPELFDYDNKTGLYSWKPQPPTLTNASAGFVVRYSSQALDKEQLPEYT